MSEEEQVLAICPRCKGNGYFNNDIQCPQCDSQGETLINKSQAYKNCYGTYESIADKGWEARAKWVSRKE